MTLSEILAKKNRPANVDLLGQPAVTRFIETPEGPHYGKEVDENGKFIKWVPKPKSESAPTIRKEDEKAKLAASIKFTLDSSAPPMPPKQQPPADTRRELGAMELGERLPMDHPPEGSPDAAWEWFDSLHSFTTDLGIVMDPNGEAGWLAVNSREFQPPLLLLRLPLINRKTYGNPF